MDAVVNTLGVDPLAAAVAFALLMSGNILALVLAIGFTIDDMRRSR